MLALLQPTYGATLPRLAEADPLTRDMQKQRETRQSTTTAGRRSIDSAPDIGAAEAGAAYGVSASRTSHESTAHEQPRGSRVDMYV